MRGGGGRAAKAALALAALYAAGYLHGHLIGPLWGGRDCACAQRGRTIAIRDTVDPGAIATCVLHHRPTRGILHARLSRCIGRSSWQVPGRPGGESGGDGGDGGDDGRPWDDGAWDGSRPAADEGEAAEPAAEGEAAAQAAPARPAPEECELGAAAQPASAEQLSEENARAAAMMAAVFEEAPARSAAKEAAAEEAAEAVPTAAPAAAAAEVAAAAPEAGAVAAPAAATQPAASPSSSTAARVRPKRVITYSLYGDNPKYVQGAVRNAELVSKVFPGWVARFYIDLGTVPKGVVDALRRAGAELVPIDMDKHGSQSMFWRFWAAADPTVERFISRDVDSRLMPRDALAVAKWVRSGRAFHVIRDHPSHSNYPMSGGLWGARRGALPQVMSLIASFPVDSKYLTDMNFLNTLVWPLAMADVLQHDAFSCEGFEGAEPFPVAVDARGNHVGQVFEADGTGRPADIRALLVAAQPEACKPGGRPEESRTWHPTKPPDAECAEMAAQHGVVPGTTWGTLSAPLRTRWQRLACDGRSRRLKPG